MESKGIEIIERAVKVGFQRALLNYKKIATQKTFKSLRTSTIQTKYFTYIDLYAHKSLLFIQLGRRAGRRMPPPKPISEWIQAKRIQFKDKRGRDLSLKSMTFLISRSIARKGIKPTNIVERAENIFMPFVKKTIADSHRTYYNNYLKSNLK